MGRMNPGSPHPRAWRTLWTTLEKTVDNSYLVAAGLPPRRDSLAVPEASATPC